MREQDYGKERCAWKTTLSIFLLRSKSILIAVQDAQTKQMIPFFNTSNNVPARVLCEKIKVIGNQ